MPFILGIRVDELSRAEALKKVKIFLNVNEQNTIFTPNPEMLVDAQSDEYFKTILNNGSLNICDGKGIQLVSRGLERIPGTDFMLDICRLAEEQGSKVYLLGSGSDEAVERAVGELKRMFPRLKIVGCDKGLMISRNTYHVTRNNLTTQQFNNTSALELNLIDNGDMINKINAVKPDILFVAFGHRKQEIWIHENLHKLPSVKVAMGVGGAFNYISGKVKRAPCSMRKIGLEWMYRLIVQPQRFNRIVKATIKFIWLVSIKKSKF